MVPTFRQAQGKLFRKRRKMGTRFSFLRTRSQKLRSSVSLRVESVLRKGRTRPGRPPGGVDQRHVKSMALNS